MGLSGCGKVLEEFLDKANIPFVLINNGRGEVAEDHPLCINESGMTAVMAGLPQADVVIVAGVRLNWVLQSGKILGDAKVVRMDIDPTEVDRNRTADAGLVGDLKDVLEALTPLVKKGNHNIWLENLKKVGEAFTKTEKEQKETPSDPIHPNRLVAKIMEVFGKDAYYVADGGDTSYYALAGFHSTLPAGVMTPTGALLGCLGTGIPFALAAKLANPDKPVVVLHGDGSFGFNGMEFDTAVRHNIPIICVVNNDCAWGMIKHSQEMSLGPECLTCVELGMRHYEKMVEGFGGHGELVTRDEEIVPALKRAAESGKPALVNVVTDPTVTSPATVMFYQGFNF